MNDWPGLTNGQSRELARELFVALTDAVHHMEPLPDDDWLDARLRERGCPEETLETWRARIRATPLRLIVDGAG